MKLPIKNNNGNGNQRLTMILILAALGLGSGSFFQGNGSIDQIQELKVEFQAFLHDLDSNLQREMNLLTAPIKQTGEDNTRLIEELRHRVNELEQEVAALNERTK